jgi:hypothetical protein
MESFFWSPFLPRRLCVNAVCGGYSIATSEVSATIDDRAHWDHLEEQRLTAAFTEFLARNRNARGKPDHYGVRVDGAAEDGFAFDLTLKFRSGERWRNKPGHSAYR